MLGLLGSSGLLGLLRLLRDIDARLHAQLHGRRATRRGRSNSRDPSPQPPSPREAHCIANPRLPDGRTGEVRARCGRSTGE
eukprot:9983351-Alexandrium_andersonii.AAC.1